MSGTYLDCPFEEKDIAKALGARWDAKEKRWYVPEGLDLAAFAQWLPEEEEPEEDRDYIYLVIGKRKCFKCNQETEVVGFGIPYYFGDDEDVEDEDVEDIEIEDVDDIEGVVGDDQNIKDHEGFVEVNDDDDDNEIDDWTRPDCENADSIAIVQGLRTYPREIRDYIEKRCGFKYKYSKFTGDSDWANTCTNCGVLQGNFYLFSEVDSPFFIIDKKDLASLEFIKVTCDGLDGLDGYVDSWSDTNQLIFSWAKEHESSVSIDVHEWLFV